jgi:hypothetical protein
MNRTDARATPTAPSGTDAEVRAGLPALGGAIAHDMYTIV